MARGLKFLLRMKVIKSSFIALVKNKLAFDSVTGKLSHVPRSVYLLAVAIQKVFCFICLFAIVVPNS